MIKNNYLILSNSLAYGGGERIAANIANGLYDSKKNVSIFIIENKVEYEVNTNVTVYKNIVNVPFLRFLNNVFAFFYLVYLVKVKKINIVISHLFRSNYINVLASFITGHKAIITTHGSISKYKDSRLSSKINLFLIKKLFFHADKKIFLTERMKDDYLNYVGLNNNEVIPNCYDIKEIDLKSKVRVNDNPFRPKEYFVFVGRFHPVKRIDLILDAAKMLGKKVLLIGDGELLKLFQDKYESKDIVFLGNKKNPYPYIKHAKAIILASESEGFPNVIVEALALGVPIISSDCRTGPREILEIDTSLVINGHYINNVSALFEVNKKSSLEHIIRNFDQCDFDERKCREIVEKYDICNVVKKYASL
ncbi:TPA: glycosyltransferase [Vibrio cholerae]|nr:glycosyltransferase [Vibrio cholerae]